MPATCDQVTPSAAARPTDDYAGEWPDRLPAETLKRLSRIDTRRAIFGIAVEWVGIAAAIAVCQLFPHPAVYVVGVMFIGARQHALAILNHEASHFRLLPSRFWNDAISDLFLAWPVMITLGWFRKFHWEHHHHLGVEGDGNRAVYLTHDAEGRQTPLWTFPKSPLGIASLLLFDLSGLLGLYYLVMTVQRMRDSLTTRRIVLQCLFYAAVVGAAIAGGWGMLLVWYWLVPLCTWFMMTNHLRIIAEHSALPESNNPYQYTRTTLTTWPEKVFLLPKQVSYHLEHHIYPSVPYYRLPELHQELMSVPGYAQRAHITYSIVGVFRELVRSRRPATAGALEPN